MKLRQALLASAFCLFASLAHAQATTSLIWDYPSTTPAYIGAAQAHSVSADGAVVASQITCSANPQVPTTTTCSLVLPASAASAGNHVYAVTLQAEGVTRTTQATIDPTKGKQPGGIRVTVSVVVQVP